MQGNVRSSHRKLCLSICLENHPVLTESIHYKRCYLSAIQFFIRQYCLNDASSIAMLKSYQKKFFLTFDSNCELQVIQSDEIKSIIKKITAFEVKRHKISFYQFVFFTDCLFLCAFDDEEKGRIVFTHLRSFFREWYHKKLQVLFDVLYHNAQPTRDIENVKKLINSWQLNEGFLKKPQRTILVTANMSAGKSTLINALVGKPIMCTSQEACTAHLCYVHNRPFEDNSIHLSTSSVNFSAHYEDLAQAQRTDTCSISTYFQTLLPQMFQICIVDTPGVDSAIHRNHGSQTKLALQEEKYDWILYVLDGKRIGSDAEYKYLKHIIQNVPKEKVTFVLNKLDIFKKNEDSIQRSIQSIREDLKKIGFEDPIIHPISAYYSLLLKMKMNGVNLTEDESDEFDQYTKKFNRSEYDLSLYYNVEQTTYWNENDFYTHMSIKCGLYGLESMLFRKKL